MSCEGELGLITGAVGLRVTDIKKNFEPYAYWDKFNTRKGVNGNLLGKSANANTSVLLWKARPPKAFGDWDSALSVSAYAQNNSIGIDAMVAGRQTKIGPVEIRAGFILDTNSCVGESFSRKGFNLGPKFQLKTPFCDFTFKFSLFNLN